MQSPLSKLLLSLLYFAWHCRADDTTGTAAPTSPPDEWGGCVDPNDRSALVTIGKKTTICLILTDGPDWGVEKTYMRLHFQPIADTYSRFHVPRSFQQLFLDSSDRVAQSFQGKNVTVHSQSQTALSFQKRYYDGFDKIFPHLTAIIQVRDGVVEGITWDDASVFCSKGRAEDNTFDFAGNLATEAQAEQPVKACYFEYENECKAWHQSGRTDCDLVLYAVWTGTDSAGASFRSSAYRFSEFPVQELGDRFSQNLPTINNPLAGVGESISNAVDNANPFNDGEGDTANTGGRN